MKGRDPSAIGMGGAALVLGVAGLVADVPALGVAAGVLGLGVSFLVTRQPGHSAPAPGDARPSATLPPPGPRTLDLATPSRDSGGFAGAEPPSSLSSAASAAYRAGDGTPPPPSADLTGMPGMPGMPDLPDAGPMLAPPGSPFVDPDTGLFNEQYFQVTVESRVRAARRHLRPVAVALFECVEDVLGDRPKSADPSDVAAAIKVTLRDADTACHLGGGRFGFVLEETPEEGAIWLIERLRRALQDAGNDSQTRWAGIACYPGHAFSAPEVMAKVDQALVAARQWAQDRIEVATTD